MPRAARVLQLTGSSALEKTLTVRLLQARRGGGFQEYARMRCAAPMIFDLHFALPEVADEGPIVAYCEVEEHQTAGNHYPLGVLLESVTTLCDSASSGTELRALAAREANLADDLHKQLRVERLEEWVDALANVARRRPARVEQAFAAVRGPHAPALQRWVQEHASDYDVVLVQGIPFDVLPRTVETLARLARRPRIVTLPHFHADDRFYYWSRYFDAFEAADQTLLFSDFVAARIGRPEKFAVVPGGGARLAEPANPGSESALPRSVQRGRGRSSWCSAAKRAPKVISA